MVYFPSEEIDDVISHFFVVVQSQFVYINIEKNVTQWLADMNICLKQYFTTRK